MSNFVQSVNVYLLLFQVVVTQPGPLIVTAGQDPEIGLLRSRNHIYMLLTLATCIVCGNWLFGIIAFFLAMLADSDFAANNKADGR